MIHIQQFSCFSVFNVQNILITKCNILSIHLSVCRIHNSSWFHKQVSENWFFRCVSLLKWYKKKTLYSARFSRNNSAWMCIVHGSSIEQAGMDTDFLWGHTWKNWKIDIHYFRPDQKLKILLKFLSISWKFGNKSWKIRKRSMPENKNYLQRKESRRSWWCL